MRSTAEIRRGYLEFFKSKGHTIVDSSALVPENDPTLLFINAGMNQFKNVFLGLEKRPYTRATTAQRCVRAGGKHNDLENVGFTARHHTFFEMMGNFSFGDYFKHNAIRYAWEFLTSPQYLALDKNRLTVTVYATDDEAYDIWTKEIGVPKERVIRIGDNKGAPYASDNFWQMADTGPCGPCTEIFYDHGEEIYGGPPGSPEEDGDRFIEIWNIVFMQYNRLEDGTMEPLPKPSVDTGMGIERVAAIKQHVTSNYDIDVFKHLLSEASKVTGQPITKENRFSLNVIADHIRSATFLIGDGVIPSNEGRGYVLRRIIRRAIRYGFLLGVKSSFFYKLVDSVIDVMEDAAEYISSPEIRSFIKKVLKSEEEQFARTLDKGLSLLNIEIEKLKESNKKELPGSIAFTLLDTYGFPYDLTVDICAESNVGVDKEGFDKAMAEQRALAKASSKFKTDYSTVIKTDLVTEYEFYNNRATESAGTVTGIYINGQESTELTPNVEAVIITDRSPFYGESGGQIGDTGIIELENGTFIVKDTQKYANAIGHTGELSAGSLKIGDKATLKVDKERRKAIVLHHTAAHLLHAALREVLGNHVHQKGSLNSDGISRFDISHPEALTYEEVLKVEKLVNYHIRKNHKVEIQEMSIDEAKSLGAQALFTDKYGDVVRVVMMSPWSIELCGGIHAIRTGDLGVFKIVSESGIAAGIRRIEYLAGDKALDFIQDNETILFNLSKQVARPKTELSSAYSSLLKDFKSLQKELEKTKEEAALGKVSELVSNKITKDGVDYLVEFISGFEVKALKSIADDILNRLGKKALVVLANKTEDEKGNILVACKNLDKSYKAGDIVKDLASKVNGKGGGKPNLAMGSYSASDNELLSVLKGVISSYTVS